MASSVAGRAVTWSDCDSEGNDPPEASYVSPDVIDDTHVPPPRTNEAIRLPFFRPQERPRLRDKFASKVSYEDWVQEGEGARDGAAPGARGGGTEKLEPDADLPVARPYFWPAYCSGCSATYHPHVPGQWSCVRCRVEGREERVWQQADDPESRSCAVCRREMAALLSFRGKRIRNPMRLNAHMCKRCGRAVCDHCYSPAPVPLDEWGYTEPQRVCTRCVADIATLRRPPEEEDLGTLHEEVEGGVDEAAAYQPHWAPKCTACNITYSSPPRRWLCTSCGGAVWQPLGAPESSACWLCSAPNPKVRCHCCGQLACDTCGAYAQPLHDLGFINGYCRSVCRACYLGVSVRPKGTQVDPLRPPPSESDVQPAWPPKCHSCQAPAPSAPKEQWTSRCHKRRAWQPQTAPESKACTVCATPITGDTSENCRRCGRLACTPCMQYREPVVDGGFAKEKPEPVCRACFDPTSVYCMDSTDTSYWRPICETCDRPYVVPPDRWRCNCGALVWQPMDNAASMGCWCCGKSTKGTSCLNCRKCGRIVCSGCGSGRAEVAERGFTRGVEYPVCTRCVPPAAKAPPPPPAASKAPPAGPARVATPGPGQR